MKKPVALAVVTLLFGIFSTSAIAQTQKTITFGSSTSGKPKAKKKSSAPEYGKNSLSIGIASYLDGFTAVTYERMLTENFTIAVGAGTTFKSFWMEVGETASQKNPGASSMNHRGEDQHDIQDDYSDFMYRHAKNGIYMSVAPKFYPRNESLDGGYISPLIEYRNYKFEADAASGTPFIYQYTPYIDHDDVTRGSDKVAENVRCLDVSAVWGGHYQLRGHIVIAYHVGLGYRNMKATRQDLGYEKIATDTYQYTNKTVTFNDSRLIGNIGFSLGGWW